MLSNYVWCTTATSDTLQFPNFVSNLKKMMGGGWAGWLQQGALILIRIYSGEFWATMGHIPHLSKGTSGCQQKCTQFLTLFSGTVFHALSHGVIRFARSASPRNYFLIGENFVTANQKLLRSWFLKLTHRAKWIPPCERVWKTMPENDVRSCVHFRLRSLLRLERCIRPF